MFEKKEEKAKVGRPKLADEVRKKDALTSIAICTVMMFVLCLSGVSEITGRSPIEVLTFNKTSRLTASAAKADKEEAPRRGVTLIRTLKIGD